MMKVDIFKENINEYDYHENIHFVSKNTEQVIEIIDSCDQVNLDKSSEEKINFIIAKEEVENIKTNKRGKYVQPAQDINLYL